MISSNRKIEQAFKLLDICEDGNLQSKLRPNFSGVSRIFRRNLLKHFNKLKPDVVEEYTEVYEEVSFVKNTKNSHEILCRNFVESKATLLNLRHLIQKSIRRALYK